MRLRKWGPCRFAALPRLSAPPPQGAHEPCRLSTFYPQLWISCPHSIHIPSTFLIACAVWTAQCGLARVSRDKGRDGSSLPCACCQFVSCWWEARGLMSVVLVVVGDCGVLPAPSMASGWWCGSGSRPVLIVVSGRLWWLVGALCSACCCLCAPAYHGLEKMFAKCVALWISTLHLC